MGSGTFNASKYYATAASYAAKDRTSLFQQRSIASQFDPLNIKQRESCASAEHPDPTSIIVACDVTGSMGKIPENLLKGGLGKIMESLLNIKAISNPQVMFAAIGDTNYDRAPLQATQFESDNRIEAQLKDLYLEGGGGGNDAESYQLIWYFAAYKTQLDSWKTNKKGLLFTMGDELVPTTLSADHIRKFIDKSYAGPDLSTSKLLEDVAKKYEVFHLIVQDTSTYAKRGYGERVNQCWRGYLGERAICVPNHAEIPEKITATVQSLCELGAGNAPAAAQEAKATDNASEAVLLGKIGLLSAPSVTAALPSASSAALSKDSDGTPNLFVCPITLAVMNDPVIAEDGHSYERASIEKWLEAHATSPTTNAPMGARLVPNHGLKSEIGRWQETQTLARATTLGH